MTYGVLFKNANSNVQIDSDSTGTGLVVVDSGTGTSLGQSVDLANKLVFARPTSTEVPTYFFAKLGTVASNGTQTVQFVDDAGNAVTANWIIAEVASELTASSSGYGLQIFNSNGDLAFESTAYNGDGGLNITDYLAAGDGSGDFDLIDTDTSKYAMMNTSSWFSNFRQGYFYGNPNNSGTGIYFEGVFIFQGGGGFEDDFDESGGSGSISESSIQNLGALLLAEGGSV